MNLLPKIKNFFRGFFRKTKPQEEIKKLLNEDHSCALVAFAQAFPHFQASQIVVAFGQCCEKWPNDGVENVDFNIVARHLDVFNKLKYDDTSGRKIADFRHRRKTYIILIYGHYTVMCNGKIIDYYNNRISNDNEVYASWEVL